MSSSWATVLLKDELYRDAIDVKAIRKSGKKQDIEGPIGLDMFLFLVKEGISFKISMKWKESK